MPFGAHETMEVHECLTEKINCINHFNLYASQAKNPRLRDMITRHQQEAISSYNSIVNLTRGNSRFAPIAPTMETRGMESQQIRYGLDHPRPLAPQNGTEFKDEEIAMAMLVQHKNGAKNSTWATLECADPSLRQALQHSAIACMNHAYEVFLFMNEQGTYQVPTLKEHTAETFMQTYQPAGQGLMSQYGVTGTSGVEAPYGMSQTGNQGYQGSFTGAGSINAGSGNSALFGSGTTGSSTQYHNQG